MRREELVAVTRDKAAALAGITERQVDYWARTGLVRPAVDRRLTPQRPIRLYGHLELMSLLTAAGLRHRGISLQHIRKIVDYLRDEDDVENPLAEIVFATAGREVYFQRPDGSWAGTDKPAQGIFPQVLDLDAMRVRIRSTIASRERPGIGEVERRRGVMGSKPVLAGTRVPVDTVRRYLEHGATISQVLKAFPVLQRADVETVRRELTAAS